MKVLVEFETDDKLFKKEMLEKYLYGDSHTYRNHVSINKFDVLSKFSGLMCSDCDVEVVEQIYGLSKPLGARFFNCPRCKAHYVLDVKHTMHCILGIGSRNYVSSK